MPEQVYCPGCRSAQVPVEKSGRLICSRCSASLPRNGKAKEGVSALDDFAAARPKAAGPMTMLRSNLQVEGEEDEGGWMDRLFPRRPKMPPVGDAAQEAASEPAEARKKSSLSARTAPPAAVEEPAAVPERPALRPTPAPQRPLSGDETIEVDPRSARFPGVLTALGFAALAMFALPRDHGLALEALVVATLGLLGVGVLGVWQFQGARRAFWQGFALFGWGYLALIILPGTIHETRWEAPTSPVLASLHGCLAGQTAPTHASVSTPSASASEVAAAPAVAERSGAVLNLPGSSSRFVDLEGFLLLGHCLLALLAGLVGAQVASRFFRMNRGQVGL